MISFSRLPDKGRALAGLKKVELVKSASVDCIMAKMAKPSFLGRNALLGVDPGENFQCGVPKFLLRYVSFSAAVLCGASPTKREFEKLLRS